MNVSRELLIQFIDKALVELTGDWIILGGTVPLIMGAGSRQTLDIDLAGPVNAPQSDTLKLMDIAASLSLPIEAINQAAAYFLFKTPNWKQNLVLVKASDTCRILRPNTKLFFELKISRLNESDLDDLISVWNFEPEKPKFRDSLTQLCEAKT